MEIVDNQDDGLDVLGNLRPDALDSLVSLVLSGRGNLRLRVDRALGAADRVQDRGPEALSIPFVALDGYESDATTVRRAVGPGPQQRGLATSRRRGDDRHPLRHSAIEHLKEIVPLEQAPGELGRGQAGHGRATVESFDARPRLGRRRIRRR